MLGLKFAAEEPASSIGSARDFKSMPFAKGSVDSELGPAASAAVWAATTELQVSSEGPDSAFARTRWAVSNLARTAPAACCLEMASFAAAVTIVHW
jgi:hypothetical protein